MLKFLEKLRALPEGSRKAVVLFSSASITTVLIVSWLVFPVPHFGTFTDAEKERKSAAGLATPFSIISGEIHESFGGIKDKLNSALGGDDGLLPSLKKNSGGENASSTATSTPGANVLSEQEEGFLSEDHATTTATTTGEYQFIPKK